MENVDNVECDGVDKIDDIVDNISNINDDIDDIDNQTFTICDSMAVVLTGTFEVFTFDMHILMIFTLYIRRETALNGPILNK